ncbi:hypothetical protein [Maritimibacter sp. DP1N21-5]|uniref:hypothetical protein n=1 Tax=Maritimibacter sp. DP1N21-5 TaxID=2836867 RepID=UPI001C478930|nr:hypothetical protein [Maritimibacter sp. DP1N21-5]MBV7408939.1 hypothetical protein [Maritimibacter sp. DP1N21-5]
MRYILTVLVMCFALPAMAQQERECRGKQAFDLGDGSYGCLLEVGTSSITTTLTRDDGASSRSSRNAAGEIVVAMFGSHSGSRQVVRNRMLAVCRTFLPRVKQELSGRNYSRIVIQLVWPRVKNTGDFVSVSSTSVDVQPAFSNANCRGIRFFG